MNKSTLRNLAIVLFALVAILIALEMGDREADVSSGDLLFDDLKSRINDVTRVTVLRPGAEGATDAVTISNASGTWSVAEREDYPASVAKIRELLIALADARILEQKTSDPERYGQLGVRDPAEADSKGVKVTIVGADFMYAIIIGNAHQGANRYVRIAEEAQSVLIDQNPSLPADAGGWLRRDIVDIDAADVRAATIRYGDGETIRIVKDAPDDSDFRVPDLPDGRELSYPTVANSIGGALNDLQLDDVRRAGAADVATTTEFETFDGLYITLQTIQADDETWIALNAAVAETRLVPDETEADEPAGADAEDQAPEPAAEAAAINERVLGWQYRIPEYKANQLTRRWDDILKAEDE